MDCASQTQGERDSRRECRNVGSDGRTNKLFELPVLDEPVSPGAHQYGKSYTKMVVLAVSEQVISLGCRRSLKSSIV